MSMEKRNVVEEKRTPEHELDRPDSNWDKEAAAGFVDEDKKAIERSTSKTPVRQ